MRDRKRTGELMSMLGLCDDIVSVVRQSRLRWYGHVMRRDMTNGIRRVLDVDVGVVVRQGRPRLEWRKEVELLCEDMLG